MTALAIGALVFKFNVGLVAVTVAVALALLSPKTQKAAIDKVSWSTVLLIAGIITYVGVMEKIGTIDYVASAISSLGMPLLVALLLCFTGAIVSAFASSTALLGAIIPLAVPFLLQGHISAIGVVAAIAYQRPSSIPAPSRPTARWSSPMRRKPIAKGSQDAADLQRADRDNRANHCLDGLCRAGPGLKGRRQRDLTWSASLSCG